MQKSNFSDHISFFLLPKLAFVAAFLLTLTLTPKLIYAGSISATLGEDGIVSLSGSETFECDAGRSWADVYFGRRLVAHIESDGNSVSFDNITVNLSCRNPGNYGFSVSFVGGRQHPRICYLASYGGASASVFLPQGREVSIDSPGEQVSGEENIVVSYNYNYSGDTCYDPGINVDRCRKLVQVMVGNRIVYLEIDLPLSGQIVVPYNFGYSGGTTIRASACCGGSCNTVEKYVSIMQCEDNDSDGVTTCDGDCDDNNSSVWQFLQGYVDNDKDGYGTGTLQDVCSGLSLPIGYATNDDDCYDIDDTIYPGAQEICDGKDNDCNDLIDDACIGEDCNSTDVGSSANFASGNLYHNQQILDSTGSGLTAEITIAYNSLDTTIGPLGRGWTHNYNTSITESGYALVFVENDGRRVYFYNNGDNTYYPDSSSGSYSTITKNTDNTYTLREKSGIEQDYDSEGWLVAITDRNNNTLSLTYTGNDLTLLTDSSARQTTLTYDANHRITSITDNAGRITAFTYGGDFLNTVTDPSGGIWNYTYDPDGNMLTKTDPTGYTTTYTYDAAGKIVSSVDPEGNTKTLSYDQINQTAYVTEKDGGQWIYFYDNVLNVPLEITDPMGNKTTYQYDVNRNLLSETEPDGSTTSYTFDSDGNKTSQTDALGNTTTYTYNGFGQITSITDPLGGTIIYMYDANSNLIAITDPSGATTQMTHDSRGNVTSLINPNAQTTVYMYDQFNNLISLTDPAGAVTTFTYDASGNMLTQTDAQGNTTRFEYNSLNQLIKITDPAGKITTYTYDANGNRTSVTDANGNTTYYEYNYKGQLTKVTDALESVTTYTYGGSGCPSCGSGGDNLTAITDSNGKTTTYQYDLLGNLIKETDPLGNIITYSYDSKGNLISKTDANGSTITYSYDPLNRLIQKTYPDVTAETFTYDTKGNMLSAGNQHISYTFSYDASGRMTGVTDSNSRTISYHYDAMGNKTQMTTPEDRIITNTYDSTNRLDQIGSWAGTFEFSYDPLSRRTELNYPNGVTTTYSYDSLSRLINLLTQNSRHKTLSSYTYSYDPVGNRLSKTEKKEKYNYTYDSIYRLTQTMPVKIKHNREKEQKNKTENYTYDPVGNRFSGPKKKDSYIYNDGNQLTDSRKYQYEYDKNGNLIRKTEIDDEETKIWTYYYDYENRLEQVMKIEDNEVKVISFAYDPFGRRIEKRVDEIEDGEIEKTKIYTYVYDNEDIIIEYLTKTEDEEEDDEDGSEEDKHHGKHKDRKDGQKIIRYIHGPGIDEPLAIEQKGKLYYYHADGLGSITALTDEKGKIVQEYEYDSFGNIKRHGHKVKQPYTYTGREWDKETGLYYYRARYYDPKIGRFINKDPIGFLGGDMNLYAYVGNNPVNFTDPLGLAIPVVIAACAATPACAGAVLAGSAATVLALSKLIETIEVPSTPFPKPDLSNTPERCRIDYEICRGGADQAECSSLSRVAKKALCWSKFLICLAGAGAPEPPR